MELSEKQLEQYPTTKMTYAIDMSEEDSKNFKEELNSFLEEKLGERAYVCAIAYEGQIAGKILIHGQTLGLDRPFSFLRTQNCLKGIYQQLQRIVNSLSAPLQNISAENNPLIKQEK